MCAIIWAGIRPGQSSPKRLSQSFQFHRSHVRSPQLSALNLSRSFFPSKAIGQTMGSVHPCFSATWGTVKPFNKSAFSGIANDGIFAKWSDKVLCGILNLFAILSCGRPSRCKRNILRSNSIWVEALKSAIYASTACLERPIACPISKDVKRGLFSRSEGSSLLLTLINFEQGSTVDLTPFPFALGSK